MKFILGKKLGMTSLHEESGVLNVTLVECGASVSDVRSEDKNGYSSIQLEIPIAKTKTFKKEFRAEEINLKKGDKIDVSIFEKGDLVNISAMAKAKGFQGVVKRHGFKGAPKSHGRKHDLRAPGSIGCGFPEHVIKGKRMAGRMGGKRATSKNIEVVFIDKEKNLLGLKGPVPGSLGNIVEIRFVGK